MRICGATGLSEKFPNQQTVLQGIHIGKAVIYVSVLSFPNLVHIEKKSLSLWFGFVSLKEQPWKNCVLLDFLLIL